MLELWGHAPLSRPGYACDVRCKQDNICAVYNLPLFRSLAGKETKNSVMTFVIWHDKYFGWCILNRLFCEHE